VAADIGDQAQSLWVATVHSPAQYVDHALHFNGVVCLAIHPHSVAMCTTSHHYDERAFVQPANKCGVILMFIYRGFDQELVFKADQ